VPLWLVLIEPGTEPGFFGLNPYYKKYILTIYAQDISASFCPRFQRVSDYRGLRQQAERVPGRNH
jgi:hypothetical protein